MIGVETLKFLSPEAKSRGVVGRRLSELAGEAGCSVLIGLAGYLDHWTGVTRVRLANCRTSDDWELGTAREYLIKPKGVLLLSAGSA
jgi:hypothetical protein